MQKFDLVKVLGRGELTVKVNVSANAFSKSAIAIIENLGGSTKVITKGTVPEVISADKSVEAEVIKVKDEKVSDDLNQIEGIDPK